MKMAGIGRAPPHICHCSGPNFFYAEVFYSTGQQHNILEFEFWFIFHRTKQLQLVKQLPSRQPITLATH